MRTAARRRGTLPSPGDRAQNRARLNPAELAHDVHHYRAQLTGLAKDKTDYLCAKALPPRPDPKESTKVS